MRQPLLLNPGGTLLAEIAAQLFKVRKTKPIWAKRIETDQNVATLEGTMRASAGDYLCRGILGELWPQKTSSLLDRYSVSDEVDSEGWQRFDPKPETTPVEAAQVVYSFRVTAHWGELTGKTNDYIVRSTLDPSDVWIVDKTIFESSYERCV